MSLSIIASKKGSQVAFVFLFMLVFLFLFGAIYIILNEPFTITKNIFTPRINESYQGTVTRMNDVWYLMPVIALLLLVVWAIYSSGGSSEDTYQGQ